MKTTLIAAILAAAVAAAPAAAAKPKPPWRTTVAAQHYLEHLTTWKGVALTAYGITPIGMCSGKGQSHGDFRGELQYRLFDCHLIGNSHSFHLTVGSKLGGKWFAVAVR